MKAHERLAAYDEALRTKYGDVIAGIDECGRGCWAGPMVAGCVILLQSTEIAGLNDSKKLSEDARDAVEALIKERAYAWGIGVVDSQYIDQKGITAANILAMERAALSALKMYDDERPVGLWVVDQSPYFKHQPQLMIAKGDGTSQAVAAASVVAKVYRDRLMIDMHAKYPKYHFDENKGYINDVHKEAVRQHGMCEIHRKSYKVSGVGKDRQMTIADFE